jgi:hypothetical protein
MVAQFHDASSIHRCRSEHAGRLGEVPLEDASADEGIREGQPVERSVGRERPASITHCVLGQFTIEARPRHQNRDVAIESLDGGQGERIGQGTPQTWFVAGGRDVPAHVNDVDATDAQDVNEFAELMLKPHDTAVGVEEVDASRELGGQARQSRGRWRVQLGGG